MPCRSPSCTTVVSEEDSDGEYIPTIATKAAADSTAASTSTTASFAHASNTLTQRSQPNKAHRREVLEVRKDAARMSDQPTAFSTALSRRTMEDARPLDPPRQGQGSNSNRRRVACNTRRVDARQQNQRPTATHLSIDRCPPTTTSTSSMGPKDSSSEVAWSRTGTTTSLIPLRGLSDSKTIAAPSQHRHHRAPPPPPPSPPLCSSTPTSPAPTDVKTCSTPRETQQQKTTTAVVGGVSLTALSTAQQEKKLSRDSTSFVHNNALLEIVNFRTGKLAAPMNQCVASGTPWSATGGKTKFIQTIRKER